MFEEVLHQFLIDYGRWAVFVTAFFFGESVIITASFLAALGYLGITDVFIFAYIGTLASDSILFVLGSTIMNMANKSKMIARKQKQFTAMIESLTKKKHLYAILVMKFLYGTRILLILYTASSRKISFMTFAKYNGAGTVLWLSVIVALGWFAGKGGISLLDTFHNIEYVIAILVLIIVAYKLFIAWIRKHL